MTARPTLYDKQTGETMPLPADLTAVSLHLPAGLTFDDWASYGQGLNRMGKAVMWWIGDWWAYGTHRWGDRAKTVLDAADGYAFQTCMDAGWVSRKFGETSRRREVLPWSFHREVAGLDDPAVADQLLDDAINEGWTKAQLRQAVKGPDVAQRIVASTENEWYTPAVYLSAARQVLGGIDLDPASCAAANTTVQARRFYDAACDGLAQPWQGRIWLNPPYGRLAGSFVARLVDEHAAGEVTAAVVLVNAHCTDTAWFQPLFDHLLCFTDHRIDFDSAGREKATTSTHGSVFAYLGSDRNAFADQFSRFGPIVQRIRP